MTESGLCPEISVLSSFLDEELDDEDNTKVKLHLQNCPACMGRLKRMDEGERLLARNWAKSMKLGEYPRREDCVTHEAMTSYLHDLLSSEEQTQLERHLDLCDACLSELSALVRAEMQLNQSRVEPLPDSLRKKVEALWRKGEKTKDEILRVAVRLARDGLEAMRDALFPQEVSLQEIFAPSGAYRSSATRVSLPSGILVKRNLPEAKISLLLTWQDKDRAGLEVRLEDEKSTPLRGNRIFVRKDAILLYSEQTDLGGKVTVPGLEPGSYRLGIHILGKELSVILDITKD